MSTSAQVESGIRWLPRLCQTEKQGPTLHSMRSRWR